MDTVRALVEIHGHVQGVFFRAETKRAADAHGVKGWVKNLDNGNVQALFEGDRNQVAAVLRWCDHGPKMAAVTQKDVRWEQYSGEYDGFNIVYQ